MMIKDIIWWKTEHFSVLYGDDFQEKSVRNLGVSIEKDIP